MSQTAALDKDCCPDQVASGTVQQEFLVFKTGDREYGIREAKVKGLRGYENVIPLRDAPQFLIGVIHYNGVIAPVVDLRAEFDPGLPAHGTNTNVLMLNIADRMIGMVVRAASAAISFADSQIKPVPDTIHPSQAVYLTGIVNLNEREIHLINSMRMMSRINTWFQLEKEAV